MDRRGSELNFSLATLLLVITLICVLLGVTMAAPGLGILLGILSLPAFVRSAAAVRSEQSRGMHPGVAYKIFHYVISLGVLFLVGVIAFFTACAIPLGWAATTYGLFSEEWFFGILLLTTIVCGIIGIVVAIKLLKKSWPGRGPRK